MKRNKRIHAGCMDTPSAGIYYKTLGKGTPVIMLHGNGGSHRDFLFYAGKMYGSCQVILMDSRGHGRSRLKSKAGRQNFTATDMTEDVKCLMDFLRLDRAVLLGFSDGANTALEFAASHPQKTLAVIAISGNARPSGLCFPVFALAAVNYYAAAFLGAFCPFGKLKQRLIQSRQYSHLILHSPFLTADRLRQITAPVLLLAGTMDLTKTSHTKWMAGAIPDSSLILLRGGTHRAFMKKREVYLRYILRFLRFRRIL